MFHFPQTIDESEENEQLPDNKKNDEISVVDFINNLKEIEFSKALETLKIEILSTENEINKLSLKQQTKPTKIPKIPKNKPTNKFTVLHNLSLEKENIQTQITTHKRLLMLINALNQLESKLSSNSYQEILDLIKVINQGFVSLHYIFVIMFTNLYY